MSNEPQPQRQKCLDFETARAVQVSIERITRWSSRLISLAERNPNAYRVEMVMGGIGGDLALALQTIALKHDVYLTFTIDRDAGPTTVLLASFDRPGSWYARGEHHRAEGGQGQHRG